MSTPAIRYLNRHNVAFEERTYVHAVKGAVFAAEAIGFPLERTIKTLVTDTGASDCVLALMPGDRSLDMKRLARACGVKRASMTDSATAERLTGYSVGGISPFGTRKRLPVFMDASLLQYERVAINGGRRGTLLVMSPDDIVSVLDCQAVTLARRSETVSAGQYR